MIALTMLLANAAEPSAFALEFEQVGYLDRAGGDCGLLDGVAVGDTGLQKLFGDCEIPYQQKPGLVAVAMGQMPTGIVRYQAVAVIFVEYSEHPSATWRFAVVPVLEQLGINPDSVPEIRMSGRDLLVVVKQECPPRDVIAPARIGNPVIFLDVKDLPAPERAFYTVIKCGGDGE